MPSSRSARPVATPSARAARSPARAISAGERSGGSAGSRFDLAALLVDRHQRRRHAGPRRRSGAASRSARRARPGRRPRAGRGSRRRSRRARTGRAAPSVAVASMRTISICPASRRRVGGDLGRAHRRPRPSARLRVGSASAASSSLVDARRRFRAASAAPATSGQRQASPAGGSRSSVTGRRAGRGRGCRRSARPA